MKFIIFLLIIFFDQISKFLINKMLLINTSHKITPFFDLVNIRNPGVSFGMLADTVPTKIISFIIITIIIALFYWFLKTKNLLEKWAIIIIIGGAIGNLLDRIIHKGEVIDFLSFHYYKYYWPAFNFADIAITLGIFTLIMANYLDYKKNRK